MTQNAPANAGNLVSGNVLVGGGELECDSVNVGYTQDGLNISFARTYLDVEADQEMNPIVQRKTGEVCLLNTSLLEITLENIKIVWDGSIALETGTVPGYLGTKTLHFGGAINDPTEHELWFTGEAPNAKTRYINIYKAVSMESGAHVYKKNAATVLPVVFKAREDITKTKGKRLGRIIDTTT